MRLSEEIIRKVYKAPGSRYGELLRTAYDKMDLNSPQQKELLNIYDQASQKFTMVHFYFKDLGIVKYSRDELYGWNDVIGTLITYISQYRLISTQYDM